MFPSHYPHIKMFNSRLLVLVVLASGIVSALKTDHTEVVGIATCTSTVNGVSVQCEALRVRDHIGGETPHHCPLSDRHESLRPCPCDVSPSPGTIGSPQSPCGCQSHEPGLPAGVVAIALNDDAHQVGFRTMHDQNSDCLNLRSKASTVEVIEMHDSVLLIFPQRDCFGIPQRFTSTGRSQLIRSGEGLSWMSVKEPPQDHYVGVAAVATADNGHAVGYHKMEDPSLECQDFEGEAFDANIVETRHSVLRVYADKGCRGPAETFHFLGHHPLRYGAWSWKSISLPGNHPVSEVVELRGDCSDTHCHCSKYCTSTGHSESEQLPAQAQAEPTPILVVYTQC
ncbi:hypothetical protein BKA93DRAFT_107873 [Sparassis latifolia]